MADNAENVSVLRGMREHYGNNPLHFTMEKAALDAAILALSPAAAGEEKITAYVMDPGAGSGCDRLIFARSRSLYESDVKSRGGSFTPLYTHPQPQGVVGEEMVERFARVYWKDQWPFLPDNEANRELMTEFRAVIRKGLTAALHPPTREGQP